MLSKTYVILRKRAQHAVSKDAWAHLQVIAEVE
jgi:hypothetical protein